MNNMSPTKEPAKTGGILDVIAEKSHNIEQATNNNTIKQTLSETLRLQARRERLVRDSTISIKIGKSYTDGNKIAELVEKEWVAKMKRNPISHWQSTTHTYIQFVSKEEKNNFLDHAKINMPEDFDNSIEKPNSNGEHIDRRPIRVEISSVRPSVEADKVKEILHKITAGDGGQIQDFREGKQNAVTKNRSILFKVDQQGFKVLFGTLEGALPYSNLQVGGIKTRLYMKINAKPWQCRDCFAIGRHQCRGKICGNCGQKEHNSKDCRQKTKYCTNCRQRGHRAKDPHCSVYLNEVAREVRKMCLPMEYLEDKELRFILSKHLQIK